MVIKKNNLDFLLVVTANSGFYSVDFIFRPISEIQLND